MIGTAETAAETAAVTAIVPAFDEAGTVGAVVAGLRDLRPPPRVIVVDDGSRDDTGAHAAAAGAEVLRHARQRGNGAAVKTGLAAVHDGIVVVLDADGQHDPSLLPELVDLLAQGSRLAVVARHDFRPSGWTRALGNRALALLATGLTGRAVPDLTSGFRAFRRCDMEPYIALLPDGFGTPATTTLAFLHAGARVAFLPARSRPREGGGATRTRLLRDGAGMLRLGLGLSARLRPGRSAVLGLAAPLALAGGVLAAGGSLAQASLLAAAVTPLVAAAWVRVERQWPRTWAVRPGSSLRLE